MQELPATDEEFKKLRNPLLTYFAGRGLSPAEDFADEVILRVVTKISEGEVIENINKYAYGVAKFVCLEKYKEPKNISLDITGAIGNDRDDTAGRILDDLIVKPIVEEESIQSACLKKCLKVIKTDKREMLMAFYETKDFDKTHVDKRKEIADRYQMSIDTLYTNVCRIRKTVGDCTKLCVSK